MLVQYVFEIFYLALFALIISFIIFFYVFSRRPPKGHDNDAEFNAEAMEHKRAPPPGGSHPCKPDSKRGMESKERNWLYFLLAIVLLGNLVTLSPVTIFGCVER
jgi:Na+/H+ antiporter NhaC